MATHERSWSGTDRETAPQVVAVCGLPGVGKSTVARRIANRVGGVHLRTDEIRKELFSDPEYTDAETRAVYAELVDRARVAVERGTSAVLDGTFKRRAQRAKADRILSGLGVPWTVIRVDADRSVVRKRIRERTDDVSDADVEIYERFREEWDPIEMDHLVVDNSANLEETHRQLERLFPLEGLAPSQ